MNSTINILDHSYIPYRFAFNGKEKDDEVKGAGNSYDYGMRMYDPRIGRFLSVDPITNDYPELTPYQFASNRPIDGNDLDGLEFVKKVNGDVYYVPPKSGNGNPADPMTANGQPSASAYNQAGNQTIIRTVNFKEIKKNTYKPSESITKIEGKIQGKSLKKGGEIVLRNGGKISLLDFSPALNQEKSYGTHTGLKIKLDYSPENNTKTTGGIMYLQSINEGGGKATYDATSGSNPFYFPDYANKGKFSDNPSFIAEPGTTQTFSASLLIYQKEGDTYKTVGQLDYSFNVTFDSSGKGTVENVKNKFTDLSEKKK